MMNLSPEKQAEVNQIFSKIYAGLPPEAKAKVDQIRAEGAQEIGDLESEFEGKRPANSGSVPGSGVTA